MVCGGDCRLGCLERDWRTPEISQSLHEVRWLERRDSNSRPLVTQNTRLKREDERGFAETADGRLKLTANHKDVCVGAAWEAHFPGHRWRDPALTAWQLSYEMGIDAEQIAPAWKGFGD